MVIEGGNDQTVHFTWRQIAQETSGSFVVDLYQIQFVARCYRTNYPRPGHKRQEPCRKTVAVDMNHFESASGKPIRQAIDQTIYVIFGTAAFSVQEVYDLSFGLPFSERDSQLYPCKSNAPYSLL